MNDKPWRYDREHERVMGTDVHGDFAVAEYVLPTHGRLIAAAHALARALCLVEWANGSCEGCGQGKRYGHLSDCPIDAALTAAGLTAKDREAVRHERG